MSETIAGLRKTIGSAEELHAVVRTMKALAASSISQYEQAMRALDDYYRAVQLGLSVCIRGGQDMAMPQEKTRGAPAVLVFGSDQGLVGRFNDVVAEQAIAMFSKTAGARFWAVGERVREPLAEAGLDVAGLLAVPLSVDGIIPLVDEILRQYEASLSQGDVSSLRIVYNKPIPGGLYEPVSELLLPLDEGWQHDLSRLSWPTGTLPEIIGVVADTLSGFVREFLFVSLFRACAASLASENASRLAAMQRADKNIDTLLEDLNATFHRLRQNSIDEELFDVVAGYEALTH